MQGSNPEPLMSALGQKRTFRSNRLMSALPPKADIGKRRVSVAGCNPDGEGRDASGDSVGLIGQELGSLREGTAGVAVAVGELAKLEKVGFQYHSLRQPFFRTGPPSHLGYVRSACFQLGQS